jgi:hypothetical protein
LFGQLENGGKKILLRLKIKIRFEGLRDAKHLRRKAFNSVQVYFSGEDELNVVLRQTGSKIDVKLHQSHGQIFFSVLCNLQKKKLNNLSSVEVF